MSLFEPFCGRLHACWTTEFLQLSRVQSVYVVNGELIVLSVRWVLF